MGEHEISDTHAKVAMKEETRTSAHQHAAGEGAPGLKFARYFTRPNVSPYDGVEW